MENIKILNDSGEELIFNGELLAEADDEHQEERNLPINTETIRLYRKEDGVYLLAITFQFEGMDPHHHEAHEGATPREILNSLGYPTPAVRELLESA